MVVLGVVFWIGWHRIQFVREGKHLEEAKHIGDEKKIHDLLGSVDIQGSHFA